MKKLFALMTTALFAASLSFAQAGGSTSGQADNTAKPTSNSTKSTKKGTSSKSGKSTKTSKAHKGGKKSKKGSKGGGTTSTPK